MSSTKPAVGYNRPLYCARPSSSFETSLHVARCSRASASGPLTVTSPMWETSNNPARSRTAWCSSRMPLYCTGNSQPPKSTIFPPSSCSTAFSGVFLSAWSATGVSSAETAKLAQVARAGVNSEIGDFLDYLTYERNVSINTISAYRDDLESFVGFLCGDYFTMARDQLDLRRVDHLAVRSYLAHLSRRKLSRSSTARHLSTLRSFFKYLMREGAVDANPA